MRDLLKRYGALVAVIVSILGVPAGGMFVYNQQEAVINLDVPNSYEIGELVVIDASASDVDEIIWKIFPATENFKVIGKVAYFSSAKPVDYKLILVARNNKDLVCRSFDLRFKHKEKPKPIPRPFMTEFELKVASWDRPLDKATAMRLAQSFETIGQMIESGVYGTVDGIIMATARANKTALGDNLEEWKPFLIQFQNYLESNPPVTIQDHAVVWCNLANALEKIYAC